MQITRWGMEHPKWCIRKKRQTFFLCIRDWKKVPKRDLKLKIFIRMIAEIVSLRCALSFSVSVKLRSVKSFQSNGKIARDGSISGETSDAINHRGRSATRDCSISAVVEVAPRKALRKLSKAHRRAIVANIFQITARAMSKLWPDHWLCVYWKVYGVKIKTTLFPSLNGFSSFTALFHRALKQIPRSHRASDLWTNHK